MNNKTYDGRKLVHPEYGPAIYLWDFTEQDASLTNKESHRWLCLFAYNVYALYVHEAYDARAVGDWIDVSYNSVTKEGGWNYYKQHSSPPHILSTTKQTKTIGRLVDKGAYHVMEYYEVEL